MAVAEREGITVSDDELEERIKALAQRHGLHPAKVRQLMTANGDLSRLRDDLLERRTLGAMLEKVKVHQYVKGGSSGERRTKGGIILPG
jgi:FKBP-type peptidyl-prolyl cis-trans isomerase (trigger factor)